VRRSRYSTLWVLATARLYKAVGDSQVRLLPLLRLPKGSQYRQDRLQFLNESTVFRAAGCGHYRPYAFSAPMNAAALATELVV